MRASRRPLVLLVTMAVAGSALTLPSGGASARPGDDRPPRAVAGPGGETARVGPDYNAGKPLPRDRSSFAASRRSAATEDGRPRARGAEPAGSQVGMTKTWMALDNVSGQVYVKDYRLRGLGEHIAVWVADDRDFPADDCRNALGLTDVSDAQVRRFVTAFDSTIYPRESEAFSVPPRRDGSDAPLAAAIGQPADYYQVPAAEADDTVVLVDNVRDTNYYRPTSPDGQTYIAGFFYSVFNRYVDRNVMTIDAFDWQHRTGATPPTDADDPSYRACSAAQGLSGTRGLGVPRPQLYEGTFAHEYQHLLESYVDPDEEAWVNEGLSDYAQSLVGYVDPTLPPDDPTADAHIRSFLGFAGAALGGPENSLTRWQDQGGTEILSDYGAAYTMMTYLAGRYGPRALSLLHREPGNGLAGLDRVLDQLGARRTAERVLHDWAAAMALDTATEADDRWAPTGPFSVDTLRSRVNWETAQAFGTPGAPPNGSDYVRFRDAAGRYLDGRALRRLRFDGSDTLTPQPVEWTTDPA
ncbi:MAG: peptidase M6, partial [Nocardioidaceae bacterium]